MPLHPQAAAALARAAAAGVRPDHELTVAEARAKAEAPKPGSVEPVASIEDLVLPDAHGGLRVRVTTPSVHPLGVVLYLHGGGHVTGTVDSYDGLTRRLANRVPAVVVSVDYRRAPEHRCPAAVEDAETAYAWLLEHAARLAPGGSIAVAGDSAGGNNAAVLVRRLRDAGRPLPVAQVLLYPPVDAVAYLTAPDTYPSYRERGSGFGLAFEDGVAYWRHYLGPDGDPASPDASPIHAPDLVGLPPAYVLTVEYDVLRDEGRAYAERLRESGVPTVHRHWEGHLHGFLGDPATYDDADVALEEIAAYLRLACTGGSG